MQNSELPELLIEIFGFDDNTEITHAHRDCFKAAIHPGVQPDSPADHGRIPQQEKCAFCGIKLRLVGKHPLCFDVGSSQPPNRYWAHTDCMATICNYAPAK